MKKLFQFVFWCALLSNFASAQPTKIPAKQVSLSVGTNAVSIQDYLLGTNIYVLFGTNIVGATYTNNQWTGLLVGTNIIGATYDATNKQWSVNSQVNNLLSGTNIVDGVFSNNQWVIGISSNTLFLSLSNTVSGINSNFNLVSNNFSVLEAYLLGGSVSNQFTNVTWSTSGSASNSALIPALAYNQNKYATNFIAINTNTYLTTNLFLKIVGDFLGLSAYATNSGEEAGIAFEKHSAYTNVLFMLSKYATMGTDLTPIPSGLSFNFPDLFEPVEDSLIALGEAIEFPNPQSFHLINATNGNITISHENGRYQAIAIGGHNINFVFSDPPVNTPYELNLWVKNNNSYTNIQYTGSVIVNTNALNISGKLATTYSKYHASPFSTPLSWYEEVVYPSSFLSYTSPPAPASQSIVVTVANTSNCTVEITTNSIEGATHRIYTFYPTTPTSKGYATFISNTVGVYRVTVVGGGGGGSIKRYVTTDHPAGGGGGGVVQFNDYWAVPAGSWPIVVGEGGSGGLTNYFKSGDLVYAGFPGGTSSFYNITASGGGGAKTDPYRDNSRADGGGDSGTFKGGSLTAYGSSNPYSLGGPGGAGGGTTPGARANYDVGGNAAGGAGAAGVSRNARGFVERFGAGGGGGGGKTAGPGGEGGGGFGGVGFEIPDYVGAFTNFVAFSNHIGKAGTGFGAGGGGHGKLGFANTAQKESETIRTLTAQQKVGFNRGNGGVVIISHPINP